MQETNAPSWWKIRLDFNYAILLVLLFTFLLTFYHITNLHISLWDETDYMIAAGKVAEDKNLLYLGAGLKPVYMLGLSLFTLFFLQFQAFSSFTLFIFLVFISFQKKLLFLLPLFSQQLLFFFIFHALFILISLLP